MRMLWIVYILMGLAAFVTSFLMQLIIPAEIFALSTGRSNKM